MKEAFCKHRSQILDTSAIIVCSLQRDLQRGVDGSINANANQHGEQHLLRSCRQQACGE